MNVNSASTESVGLVGYLPVLEVSESLRSLTEYKECQHYILQECIGHVLSLIEQRAVHGFKAVIADRPQHFFPRLGAMTLDTKERVKYFGLRSDRTCGTCRLRLGRSAARISTRHDSDLVHLLMDWAVQEVHSQDRISQRAKARAKLSRHGWLYKRRCRLHDFANKCLIQIPRFGNLPYAGLIQFDRMHVFFLNYCTYCMELLTVLVIHPIEVQRRVKDCHQFRDPITGVTHPRLPSVLKLTHFTAERRVRAIFYWAHVLGTGAEVIDEDMRIYAQVAVSTLQILLIALRGHRAYTENELNTIFKDVGKEFFSALEILSTHIEKTRMHNATIAHQRRPSQVRQPLPYKRQRRLHYCVLKSHVIHLYFTCNSHTFTCNSHLLHMQFAYISQPFHI